MERQKADFINEGEIQYFLEIGKEKAKDVSYVKGIIERAGDAKGLNIEEVATLLNVEDDTLLEEMYKISREIKQKIYGNRIVMFAPLYISDHCVNDCVYCGYKCSNKENIDRKKLDTEEIIREIEILEDLGHKRVVLEAGEDPENCPIDYVVDCMKTIYSVKKDNGSIRRINVNIASTTVENYTKLKEAGIGTYILFQETYHRETYKKMHPKGPKHDYDYHTTAMDRAMKGGIDDVGIGVLYGLYDYKFETVAMFLHAKHLDDTFGVGPHTISVPRLRPAVGVDRNSFPHLVNDHDFKKLVAIIRLAVPYTGMIVSTREEPKFREEIIAVGISQISAGSSVDVGGYEEEFGQRAKKKSAQFQVSDTRTPIEVLKKLCKDGYIPSYCTACYRQGRTGERFMSLAKTGNIHNVCLPNAIMTFQEFLLDYADDELKEIGQKTIEENFKHIESEKIKEETTKRLERIKSGERDLYF
ncbi:[FeFe] hydrogenase H-cluster radical SAM maturase HydG [Clostridium sp. DJ247]|uniref:[FeFe] hydrogenase H-cluster radical SAM maturase HydG n=1 Tax=Clostridium sp. DJ247 TaxID=2726188 RepID=UPI00162705A8|nr:[FeFe] hydrogenase H-cluster radical SAM maturase HydG [Clostridium sp. DJ247]MBC2581332.1 [FeFe] hydrogenase H-cluster radical SAM maturase HydG [Clostridium sp. DJ247]